MTIKTREVMPDVLLLQYESNYELAMAFVRIQEYYEGPDMKGRVFSLEEYVEYWKRTFGMGRFNYPEVWSGFNVPGDVLQSWMQQYEYSHGAPHIREEEKNLISNVLSAYPADTLARRYVIGSATASGCVIDHEVAHALYKLRPEYKAECSRIFGIIKSDPDGVREYNTKSIDLLVQGYHADVLEDEIQAYWTTCLPSPPETIPGIRELKQLYSRHRYGTVWEQLEMGLAAS